MRSSGVFLLGVLLTACEPRPGVGKPGHRLVVADVILTVVNRTDRAVPVSLESDTLDYLLGTVGRRTSASFSLPSGLGESPPALRLKATPEGAPPVRSDPFQVRRGQKVVWTFGDEGRGTVVY